VSKRTIKELIQGNFDKLTEMGCEKWEFKTPALAAPFPFYSSSFGKGPKKGDLG